jgi:hypothetical protein
LTPKFTGARNQKHAPESERAFGYTVVCGIKRVIAKKGAIGHSRKELKKQLKGKKKQTTEF